MLPGGSFIDDTALALLVDEYQDERVLSSGWPRELCVTSFARMLWIPLITSFSSALTVSFQAARSDLMRFTSSGLRFRCAIFRS